jgi:hypothetical protein
MRSRFVLLFVFSAALAFAHNPNSSWAILQVFADRCELKVELASESAWLFLGETLDSAPDVEHALPRLRAKAADVYRLAAAGRTLVARETGAELREEDGVVFTLVFARPAADPVHFEALYLKRLPADHRTTLTVLDAAGNVVRGAILNAAKPAVDLAVIAAAATPSPTRP